MRVSFYGRCRGESESRYVNDCLYSGLETDGFFMKMLVKKWKNYIPGTDLSFYYQLYIGPGNGSGLPGYGTRG